MKRSRGSITRTSYSLVPLGVARRDGAVQRGAHRLAHRRRRRARGTTRARDRARSRAAGSPPRSTPRCSPAPACPRTRRSTSLADALQLVEVVALDRRARRREPDVDGAQPADARRPHERRARRRSRARRSSPASAAPTRRRVMSRSRGGTRRMSIEPRPRLLAVRAAEEHAAGRGEDVLARAASPATSASSSSATRFVCAGGEPGGSARSRRRCRRPPAAGTRCRGRASAAREPTQGRPRPPSTSQRSRSVAPRRPAVAPPQPVHPAVERARSGRQLVEPAREAHLRQLRREHRHQRQRHGSDARIANEIVRISSRKISAARPVISRKGSDRGEVRRRRRDDRARAPRAAPSCAASIGVLEPSPPCAGRCSPASRSSCRAAARRPARARRAT